MLRSFVKPKWLLPDTIKYKRNINIAAQTIKADSVKPYEEIPLVTDHPLETLYLFASGKNSLIKMHEYIEKRIAEYGSIYREKIGFTPEKVYTTNPDDFQKLFSSETRAEMPVREKLWSLERYHKEKKLPLSIADIEGESWYRMRESLKPILIPKEVAKLVPMHAALTDDFLNLLKTDMEYNNTDVINDFVKYLNRWTFECSGMNVYRRRFGMFDKYEDVDKEIQMTFEGHIGFFKQWSEMETGSPLNKYFNTKHWKKFEQSMDNVTEGGRVLYDKYEQYVVDRNVEGMTDEECFITVNDVLRASIDTISQSALWCMITLSRNLEVQDKIFEEVKHVVGDKDFNNSLLQKLPYVRGTLKEVFRTKPLISIQARKTRYEVELSGYRVPANTDVGILLGFVDQGKHFTEPEKILPERWFRAQKKEDQPHGFSVLPFGHGMRSCIGRRIAENILIAKMMQKYRIHAAYGDIGAKYEFLQVADRPISLRFERR